MTAAPGGGGGAPDVETILYRGQAGPNNVIEP
jgi:hypothetical protein